MNSVIKLQGNSVMWEFTRSSSGALQYWQLGQARHTRTWPVTTMKYAGATSGICICLQTGLDSAPGKRFPFHKVSGWTLIIFLQLMRKEIQAHSAL